MKKQGQYLKVEHGKWVSLSWGPYGNRTLLISITGREGGVNIFVVVKSLGKVKEG